MRPDANHSREWYEECYARAGPSWLERRLLLARPKAQRIQRLAAGLPHHNVLEIGCGTGPNLVWLDKARFMRSCCGTDVSLRAVTIARRAGIGSLVGLAVADAAHQPFANGSFDLAILCDVLGHVQRPNEVLKEAARVARRVVVEVPLESVWWARVRPRFGSEPDAGHIHRWSASDVGKLAEKCGLLIRNQIISVSSGELSVAASRCRVHPSPAQLWHLLIEALKSFVKATAWAVSRRLYLRLFVSKLTMLCESPVRDSKGPASRPAGVP